MTADDIVAQLKTLGTDDSRNILLKHGVSEPVLGVKIEDLKLIQKQVRKNHQLALDLYDTGIYDAMYLAGLVADDMKMSRAELQHWAEQARCAMISEYTVAWVTGEGQHGHALALEWIASAQERVAASGWATLGGLVSITEDAELDLDELRQLMRRVQQTIYQQPERVRHTMRGFVIAVGCHVSSLTALALETGAQIAATAPAGAKANTDPIAEAIAKVQKRGTIGKKRKTMKC